MFQIINRRNWSRSIRLLFVATLFALSAISPNVASAQDPLTVPESSLWEIQNFRADIQVTDRDRIEVKETIDAYFFVERHGIFRTIPYKYDDDRGDLKIDVAQVTNGEGVPIPYTVTNIGDYIEIKIGDPDEFVIAEQRYVIEYDVRNVIGYFEEHDELYWNATGNEWPVPIAMAEAVVKGPENLPEESFDEIQARCYTGGYASTEQECEYARQGLNTAFRSNRELDIREGLTVVVGYPKGFIQEPTFIERYWLLFVANLGACLPFIVFPITFLLWRKYGKDPKGRGTIMPQYEPPEGLLPAEVGVIYDNSSDMRDISATVIDLAIRGYIQIEELPKKALSKQDYAFHLLKTDLSELKEYEINILTGIFGTAVAEGEVVKLNSLKEKFYQTAQEVNEALYTQLTSGGYYTRKPKSLTAVMITLGTLIGLGSIFLLSVLAPIGGYLTFCGLLLSGVAFLAIAPWMSQRTAKGTEIEEHIKGLKMYLEIAEEDRIKTLQGPDSEYVTDRKAPKRDVKLFEKLLPYAMVLKVEKAWADKFKDIYKEPPDWYSGSNMSTFNTIYLMNSLSNAATSMNSTFTSTPRSSGSGFSSGGGFSGGGSGGGGGGSW
ncbi:MAG: DUF2207 domain-containing protein [Candidatus Dojkabacteria bacterium]|nr:MAG: DUF2207 domain-containing protein [Candidatus Dojkabacteria bacterium]